MCDIWFEYIKEPSIPSFISAVGLSINTKNYPYYLEFMTLIYFNNKSFEFINSVDENGTLTSSKKHWNHFFYSEL